jgi:thiol-disulfide isomerase/thioredoxin
MLKELTLIVITAGLALATALPVHALTPGDKAPLFEATTLDGENVDLAELVGEKPVYLKFWATWCRYCVNELPHAQHVCSSTLQQPSNPPSIPRWH